MGRASVTVVFLLVSFLWFVTNRAAASGATPQEASPSSSYYVRSGNTLQTVAGDPGRANYREWQVWLYPQAVRLSASGAGLVSVRWGIVQGVSAKAVMEQLAAYQEFERAYTNFFGVDSWGAFTFSHVIGPVAVSQKDQGDDAAAFSSKIDLANRRLSSVVAMLRSSLENGERSDESASIEQYFKQVRDSMLDIARFYDKLSRVPTQRSYLDQVLGRLMPGVNQAESGVSRITAVLPSVKLPVSRNWMTQTENGGRDGTIAVTIREIGSSAWVQESWSGGDGSMSGTNVITIVPYQDIGSLDVWVSTLGKSPAWTLRIQPANANEFRQSFTSPERMTAIRSYPAVDLKTSEGHLLLKFSNATDAQDAYAFFLYHKQRGM